MQKRISLILVISILSSLIFGTSVFAENAEVPKHVIINQIYGGGDLGDSETPVSHSFIELYNPTDERVNLDGWSVQYAASGTDWKMLTLKGAINAHSSFLIRCGAHNNDARLKIDKYDMSWGIAMNNKGIKVLLKSDSKRCGTVNPYYEGTSGYVDMIGAAGNEHYYLVDGYESDYLQIQSKQKSIRRKKFRDTDNNAADVVAIDYRTAELSAVRPRSSYDGAWENKDFTRTKDIKITPLEDSGKDKFTFLHLSDTQASTAGQFEVWGRLSAALSDEEYDFSIHTGDVTDNTNNIEEMDMFYENSGKICEKPFMAVTGNHDKKSAALFEKYFGSLPGSEAPLPVTPGTTASFDYGNAHFVILNSESDLQVQAKWLDSELEKTDKKWKIVALHRSPYGAVGMEDTAVFTPIFDKHHTDLVIHGHDHLYLRTYPIYNGKTADGGTVYLESGSSGVKQEGGLVRQEYQEISISPKSPTYSSITVSDDEISVTAKTLSGSSLKTIDSFTIKKYSGAYDEVQESQYENTVRTFSDIRADRPFYDAVMLLAQLGIVEKTASFMPDEKIKRSDFFAWLNRAGALNFDAQGDGGIAIDEAVSVILDSLGYTIYTEATGQSRDTVARDIGLFDDTERFGGGELTRGYAAQLIKNALEAYIVKLVKADGAGAEYAQVYETWLNNVHNVYKTRGIIIDRPYYTSAAQTMTFVNEYGEEIQCDSTDEVYSLLGYEIDGYLRDGGEKTEMLYGIKTAKNNELTVKKSWYGDVESVDKYINFSYDNLDTNRSYTVKIDKNADFVYNGAKNDEIRKKALACSHNAFKPSHIGRIKLVDYNDDNVYDFVFIDNYKDIVVSGIDPERKLITNKLQYNESTSVKKSKYTEISEICLDKEDGGYMVSFSTPEEKPSSFSAITKNSVVSVALSSLDGEDPESALVRRVYISNYSAAGEITRIFEEDEDDYFVIDGKAYRASKSYYNTFNGGESVDFADLKVGDFVSLYLDYDERFAYVGRDESGDSQMYGILLSCEYDANEELAYLRIVGDDGDTKIYTMTKKKYEKSGLARIAVPAVLKLNIHGTEIKDFESTELEKSGEMTFLNAGSRLGDYFLDKNSKIFLYKGERNDSNTALGEYYDAVDSDFLRNREVYDADIINVRKYCFPSVVVLNYSGHAVRAENDGIMLVSKIRTVVNKDGDAVYAADGYVRGEKITVQFPVKTENVPSSGDVIRYRTDADKAVVSWEKICDAESEPFETNTVFDDIFIAKYNGVHDVENGIITVGDANSHKSCMTDKNTSVYNIEKAKNGIVMTKGSCYTIVGDDRLLIISREGMTDEIYVWKNY